MPNVKYILSGIKYKSKEDLSGVAVKNITDDSRKVERAGLFIAAGGYDTDGHRFIGEAMKKGPKVVVAEKDFKACKGIKKVLVKDTRTAIPIMADNFYGHPSRRLKIIGVTGTNGKTTVTYLIENILKAAKKEAGVIGTINYRIKGNEIPSVNTTPGPIELQALLASMLKDRVRYAVMEISSHSLDQDRAGRISFDIGIFTNITRDHLDYHKTIRNYFKAKAKLFKKLKPGGTAILNNDDSMVSGLKRRIKNKALTYGIDNASDVMAQDVKLSISSSSFTVKTLKGSFGIRTSLIGKHNVSNILAGTACAIALGMPLGTIKRGIELFRSVPGRLELIDYDIGFKVFVDYAHTHDALYNVLALLKGVTREGRIITVFGCGGNRDRTKRPLMGEVACKLSDRVVITSDNPRLEDPAKIISHIEAGIKGRYSNYDIVEDRRCAIGRALEIAGKGDIVIIAGKGHEKYQIIKDKNIPFDDREVAASILKTMPCR